MYVESQHRAYCRLTTFNPLALGRCGRDFQCIIFKLIIENSSLGIRFEIALMWMPHNFINMRRQHRFRQVMVQCRQATRHCCRHCWPWSMSQYNITMLHWVKSRNSCIQSDCQIRFLGLYSLSGKISFDGHLGSAAAEVSVKFESDWKSLNPNLAASILDEILWQDVLPLSE